MTTEAPSLGGHENGSLGAGGGGGDDGTAVAHASPAKTAWLQPEQDAAPPCKHRNMLGQARELCNDRLAEAP